MYKKYKKGAGNKQQAYIAKGNGSKSGQYCNDTIETKSIPDAIKNYIDTWGGESKALERAKTFYPPYSLRYSNHFFERFQERGIRKWEVIEAIIAPDIKTESLTDAYGRKSMKLITNNVTVVINPTTHLLLTVYPTNKANRNKIKKEN